MTSRKYNGHQAGREGLGYIGEDANKGIGGPQSGINVLQFGDIGGNPIWLGGLGHIN